jgi:NitT/TauT family transport system permease protein
MRTPALSRKASFAWQATIVLVFLAAWQFLPEIPGLSKEFALLDPFFISSPTRVAKKLHDLMLGTGGITSIWPFVATTLEAALIGTAIAIIAGALAGLLLSNDERLNQVLRPFVVAVNAIPRIALIPIVVIMFGLTATTSIVTAVLVVFFVVFFNAYAGGRTVPTQVLENSRVLGATPAQIMLSVRLPYVLAWTFAALPNAVSFGLISVVTAEILTGHAGLGRLLIDAVNSASADLTFAVVIVLGVVGLAMVLACELFKSRLLHWWGGGLGDSTF